MESIRILRNEEVKSTVNFLNHIMHAVGFKKSARFPIYGYGYNLFIELNSTYSKRTR